MTAHLAFTDAALEAMLVRRAARARPHDLHEKILVAIEEVPQARRPLLAWPWWFTAPVPGFGSMKAVVIVALLLALATGLALVASRWLDLLPHGTIAFAKAVTKGADIYAINADGTGLTRLADGPAACLARPAWSPDGSRIAYHAGIRRLGRLHSVGDERRRFRADPAHEGLEKWVLADMVARRQPRSPSPATQRVAHRPSSS